VHIARTKTKRKRHAHAHKHKKSHQTPKQAFINALTHTVLQRERKGKERESKRKGEQSVDRENEVQADRERAKGREDKPARKCERESEGERTKATVLE